jgi:hypothetical protein
MIRDEFTDLTVCRQYKYQLRHKRDGLCLKCRSKAINENYCERHRRIDNVRSRERGRLVRKRTRRNGSGES